jgi:hypothetical protein
MGTTEKQYTSLIKADAWLSALTSMTLNGQATGSYLFLESRFRDSELKWATTSF